MSLARTDVRREWRRLREESFQGELVRLRGVSPVPPMYFEIAVSSLAQLETSINRYEAQVEASSFDKRFFWIIH